MSLEGFTIVVINYCKEIAAFFWYKVIVAAILGLCGFLLGVYQAQEIAIMSLLILMVVDFLLGFARAVHEKKVSSIKLKIGLGKFVVYMLVIIAGYGADLLIFKQNIERGFHYFFVVYLGVTELISIVEHLGTMGINLPFVKDLKKIQKQLSEEGILDILFDNKSPSGKIMRKMLEKKIQDELELKNNLNSNNKENGKETNAKDKKEN